MIVRRFETAEDARAAGQTYHLTPHDVWERQWPLDDYLPEAFDRDGFIHATNGLALLLAVANASYVGDPRPYLVLVVEVARIRSEVRYDDPDKVYPHIYGPLNVDAVVGLIRVLRESDGRFSGFGDIVEAQRGS